MRILKSISIVFILLTGKILTLDAQVTFGGTIAPKKGVLLDLKQNDNDAANSTLGLLLPRVYVEYSNQLNPMLDELTDYPSNTTVKNQQDQLHVGLLVYNLNQCLLGGGKDKGMVVWNGTQWASLSNSVSKAADVVENLDQEGNIFYSKDFGTQGTGSSKIAAGEWMLSNLQVKKFDTQSAFPGVELASPLTPLSAHANWKWAYPNKDGQNATDPTSYNLQKSLGLLYNYYLANGLDATTATQGEGQAAALRKGEQGLCPNGWHMPSDLEWNQMLEILYNDPSLSSDISRTQTWNKADNSTAYSISNLSDILLTICYPVGVAGTTSSGKSFQSVLGGFNAILAGNASTSGSTTTNADYGKSTSFWTASGNTTSSAWARQITDNGAVKKLSLSTDSYFASIRCRRDGYIPFETCGEDVQDAAGNTYTTAKFGNQCWINQNMRYIGGSIGTSDVVIPGTGAGGTLNTAYGYLYTWDQATGGANADILMPDEIGDANATKVQGICPTGWHIPSDYEWALLEVSAGAPSVDAINVIGMRPIGSASGWGYKLMAQNSYQPGNTGGGTSAPNTDEGFSAYLSGYGDLDASKLDYGNFGYYWTASKVFSPIGVETSSRQRTLQANSDKVGRDSSAPEYRMSVRCVLD